MKCPNCSAEQTNPGAFCTQCGAPFPSTDQEPQTAVPRKLASVRDYVLLGLLLVLCLFAANIFIYGEFGIAMAVCCLLLPVLTIWYASKSECRCTPYFIIVLLLYGALSVSMAFHENEMNRVFTALLLPVLFAVLLMELLPLRRFRPGSFQAIADGAIVLFADTFGNIGKAVYGLFHKNGSSGVETRKTSKIVLGLLISIPFAVILVVLLVSSDAAFDGLMDKLTTDLDKVLVTAFFGLSGTLLLFSLLFVDSAVKRTAGKEKEERKGLDTVILISFFSVITLVYVLYLVSQFAYFFNGFANILPEEFTMAEYARRGFFEMTAVCVINLGIIFLTGIVCRKTGGKRPGIITAFQTFLCLISLLLDATALSKMVMYMQRFGLTQSRILTTLFMLALTVVFLAVLLSLYLRNIPYMNVALIAFTVALLVSCFGNVDAIVANYNTDAYLSGVLESPEFPTDQAPYLPAYLDSLWKVAHCDDASKATVAQSLLIHARSNAQIGQFAGTSDDWRKVTLNGLKAKAFFSEHDEEIQSWVNQKQPTN